MPTQTANYGWQKPDPGASDDVWGDLINQDLDAIDSVVYQLKTWSDAPQDGAIYGRQNAQWVQVPQPSSALPPMDGSASAGVATAYARADHVHPTDASRYAASNPAGYVTAAQAASGAPVQSVASRMGNVTLSHTDITDWTATLAPYAPLASPALTGAPTAPTVSPATDSTTKLATTAFVQGAVAAVTAGVASWNGRTGAVTMTLADVTGAGGAPLASPALTGTPSLAAATATTPAAGDNSTRVATTAYVQGQASATTPAMNGTAAIGSGVTWARADHVHPIDASRAPLASPTFTGTVTIPSGASIGQSTVGGLGLIYTLSGSSHPFAFGLTQPGGFNTVSVYADGVFLGVTPFSLGGSYTPVAQWGVNSGGAGITAFYAASNSVTWAVSGSDRRLKRNIRPASIDALELVKRLAVVEADYQPPGFDSVHWDCALIAQDVEPLIPPAYIAPIAHPDGSESMAALNTLPIVATLIKAVQQLTARVAALEQAA